MGRLGPAGSCRNDWEGPAKTRAGRRGQLSNPETPVHLRGEPATPRTQRPAGAAGDAPEIPDKLFEDCDPVIRAGREVFVS